MKHTLVRFLSACVLLLAFVIALPSQPAQAQAQPALPAGLYQAFLQAASQPLTIQNSGATARTGGLNFRLDQSGVQAQSSALNWSIALSGFGRGQQLGGVQAPQVVQAGERVEYQRGSLTEWYRETALGLEQGFAIPDAPQGDGQVTLQLDVQTDLQATPFPEASGLAFAGPENQTLRYDNLRAFDANGNELKASMSYSAGQVTIQVDDSGAAYPITVDPLIYLQHKVIAVDGKANDWFGSSLALSGNTALVGALGATVGGHGAQGAAYVFTRSGTAWIFQQKLTASDGAANDFFGASVALAGSTALVGAYQAGQGAAYVFVRSGTTWSFQKKLTASDGVAFGQSVALSGDTALVGAPGTTVGGHAAQGAAYVFMHSGTSWSQQKKLTAPDGAYNEEFGCSVALSGDTALAGACQATVGSNTNQGAAYIFTRSGTTWSFQKKLTAADGAGLDFFGISVALSGNTALVGAYQAAVTGHTNQGAAYVFARSGTTWSLQQKLTAPDGAAYEHFGTSVTLSGNTALVGAPQATVGGHTNQGAAYVFTRGEMGWNFHHKLTASDGAMHDMFGNSVALSGDTALVGARSAAVSSHTLQGAVYFFEAYRDDTDLAASAGINTTQASPGNTVYLSASVTNLGPSSASYVVQQASLPAGLTYVSNSATQGYYDPSTGSWSMDSLGLAVGATLTIQAKVNLIPSQTLTFSTSILGLDTNNANNSASAKLKVKTTDLALNGGFNTYPASSQIPTSWTAAHFSASDGKDTTTKKEGAASVRINGQAATTKTLTQTRTVSGSAGSSFLFSLYAKAASIPTSSGVVRAQVLLYNGSSLVQTKTITFPNGTYGFTKKSLAFTASGSYTKIVIKLTYSKASGTVWFDALSLLEAP